MAGQEGVYFTAAVVEEMMSVNGQEMEMGMHQVRGSLGLFKGAREAVLLLPADQALSASWPLVQKMPGCCKPFKAQVIWKRGRPRSRRAFEEVLGLLASCIDAENPAQLGPSSATLPGQWRGEKSSCHLLCGLELSVC